MADQGGPHAYHDPLLAASLLDDDLSPEERAATEAAIAGCPQCLALRADLVALASATRDLPVPARPRDFTLSVEVAAGLAAMDAGEPGGSQARLTGDMNASTTSSQHASHDTILVASLVDRSLPDAERVIAERQVGACGQCATLFADLEALRVATRAMPTPPRTREYTLTPELAAGLRPHGWRRWVAAIGSSRDVFSRPLAVGLTTLGLAGLLIANVPSFTFGGATSGALPIANDAAGPATDGGGDVTVGAPEASGAQAAPGAAALPSADLAAPVRGSGQPVPAASGKTAVEALDPAGNPSPDSLTDGSTTDNSGVGKSGTGKGSGRVESGPGSGEQTIADGPTVSPLVLFSASLLIVGLGLFALRWGARRFGD